MLVDMRAGFIGVREFVKQTTWLIRRHVGESCDFRLADSRSGSSGSSSLPPLPFPMALPPPVRLVARHAHRGLSFKISSAAPDSSRSARVTTRRSIFFAVTIATRTAVLAVAAPSSATVAVATAAAAAAAAAAGSAAAPTHHARGTARADRRGHVQARPRFLPNLRTPWR
ncbi:unnamed protein product [Closterium sp. NIES-54]